MLLGMDSSILRESAVEVNPILPQDITSFGILMMVDGGGACSLTCRSKSPIDVQSD